MRKIIAATADMGLEKCCRCGDRIAAGEPWDLDHSEDRTYYIGASHASCNRGRK